MSSKCISAAEQQIVVNIQKPVSLKHVHDIVVKEYIKTDTLLETLAEEDCIMDEDEWNSIIDRLEGLKALRIILNNFT